MNHKSYVHQISEIGPIERVQLSCECERDRMWSRWSGGGKAKIEGYMSVSDEEAHHPLSTEIVTVLSHIATGEC